MKDPVDDVQTQTYSGLEGGLDYSLRVTSIIAPLTVLLAITTIVQPKYTANCTQPQPVGKGIRWNMVPWNPDPRWMCPKRGPQSILSIQSSLRQVYCTKEGLGSITPVKSLDSMVLGTYFSCSQINLIHITYVLSSSRYCWRHLILMEILEIFFKWHITTEDQSLRS